MNRIKHLSKQNNAQQQMTPKEMFHSTEKHIIFTKNKETHRHCFLFYPLQVFGNILVMQKEERRRNNIITILIYNPIISNFLSSNHFFKN